MPKVYDSFSERLTRVTLGVDALERRQNRGGGPLDSEGLVPIYLGGDLIAAPAYADWAEVESELDELQQARPLEPQPRRVCATAMLCSLRAAVHLFRGGSGEPVLFLHAAGGAGAWLEFHGQLAGAGFDVIARDHPGFAMSDDFPLV